MSDDQRQQISSNHPLKPNPKYRFDIDGLRAIAVLSVIIFHISETLLPGGYVGVDVFFVISGFLISLQVIKEVESGRFSIAEFYRRRIKRIVPAMLVVVFVTVFAAQLLMRPVDAEGVAESGLWSLLSFANLYFWLNQDTSYFAQASNELPLLHLWSLGVEEQFYFFWPLLVLAASRLGSKIFLATCSVIICVASFTLAESLFSVDPLFTYYMLPTRAGELMLGALSAMLVLKWRSNISPIVWNLISYGGLLLIIVSIAILSHEYVFPGFWAIPPTLGAAMVIVAGHYHSNFLSTILSTAPMRKIGILSYSAYLWHWPLLAFYRYGYTEVGFTAGVLIFVLTFALAWLTYTFVEQPFRKSTRSLVGILAVQFIVPAGAIACLALVSMKIDGYGFRLFSETYKQDLASVRGEAKPAYNYDYVCQKQSVKSGHVLDENCIVGPGLEKQPRIILWGDSNAAHYVGALGVFADTANFKFYNIALGSCPPIKSDPSSFVPARRIQDCQNSGQLVWDEVQEFDVVVVAASWLSYAKRSESFIDEVFGTLQELGQQGKLVIVMGKAATIPSYDRRCPEKSISFPYVNCYREVPLDEGIIDINAQLQQFAMTTPNIEYYDMNGYLCPEGLCASHSESGKVIYFDANHLALPGAWNLGEKIVQAEGLPHPFSLIPDYLGENDGQEDMIGNL